MFIYMRKKNEANSPITLASATEEAQQKRVL